MPPALMVSQRLDRAVQRRDLDESQRLRRRRLGVRTLAGRRKEHARPAMTAAAIFCWMPPIGPTSPKPSTVPVPAIVRPPVRPPGVSLSMMPSASAVPALGPPMTSGSIPMCTLMPGNVAVRSGVKPTIEAPPTPLMVLVVTVRVLPLRWIVRLIVEPGGHLRDRRVQLGDRRHGRTVDREDDVGRLEHARGRHPGFDAVDRDVLGGRLVAELEERGRDRVGLRLGHLLRVLLLYGARCSVPAGTRPVAARRSGTG